MLNNVAEFETPSYYYAYVQRVVYRNTVTLLSKIIGHIPSANVFPVITEDENKPNKPDINETPCTMYRRRTA